LKLLEYYILWTVLAYKGRVIKFRRLSEWGSGRH